MLMEADGLKDWLHKELKRLRREHLDNLKDVAQLQQKLEKNVGKVNDVVDRQGLNDQAMASVFKIMKLDHAMSTQDEIDRNKIYLMGLTNTDDTADLRLKELQKIAGEQVNPSPPPAPRVPNELIRHEASSEVRGEMRSTGKFTQKIRASTTVPIE